MKFLQKAGALALAVGVLWWGPVAHAQNVPLQTCSAAQVTATERWWFFGNGGGLDFGTTGNTPTVLPNTSINTLEGSTVVSDVAGNLLFWVGGQLNIYDRTQAVMLNGGALTANTSATQTVASFPVMGTPGKYFVVTTTGSALAAPGNLYYNVVDMSGNGGLGQVTLKNQLLATGIASEAVAAVPNSNGTGYWVITYNNNNSDVSAISFSDAGPGTLVTTTLTTNHGTTFGSIRISPDMTRIALFAGGLSGTSLARLLEFNATTGAFTEKAQWLTPNNGQGYTADFSPDGKYLYTSHIYTGQLYRYDLTSENSATIKASEAYIGATGNGGAIKRGPDGRMYIANQGSTTISVINDPNNANPLSIGFSLNALPLGAGASSVWGLPQMVTGCPQPYVYKPLPVPVISPWALLSLSMGVLFAGVVSRRRMWR